MSDLRALDDEALENITRGLNPDSKDERACDRWKEMAYAAGQTYNTGKPCTKCNAVDGTINGSTDGRKYSVYANKDEYFSGNNSVCLCYNCGHFYIYRHMIL